MTRSIAETVSTDLTVTCRLLLVGLGRDRLVVLLLDLALGILRHCGDVRGKLDQGRARRRRARRRPRPRPRTSESGSASEMSMTSGAASASRLGVGRLGDQAPRPRRPAPRPAAPAQPRPPAPRPRAPAARARARPRRPAPRPRRPAPRPRRPTAAPTGASATGVASANAGPGLRDRDRGASGASASQRRRDRAGRCVGRHDHRAADQVAQAAAALAGRDHHDQPDEVEEQPVDDAQHGAQRDLAHARRAAVHADHADLRHALAQRLPASRLAGEVVVERPAQLHGEQPAADV